MKSAFWALLPLLVLCVGAEELPEPPKSPKAQAVIRANDRARQDEIVKAYRRLIELNKQLIVDLTPLRGAAMASKDLAEANRIEDAINDAETEITDLTTKIRGAKLVIASAWYGDVKGSRDVTAIVAGLVRAGKDVKASIALFGDPAPGRKKTLLIILRDDNGEQRVEVKENAQWDWQKLIPAEIP